MAVGGGNVAVYSMILGACVTPNGSPNATLARRVEGALAEARDVRPRMFVATGGVSDVGPAEGRVIARLLAAAGVDESEILVEDRATDTLQSVLFCDALLRPRGDVECIVPCSSSYHNLRCAVLLRILGYPVRHGPMSPDLPHLGAWKWSRYVFKEILALPYDATLLWLRNSTRAARRKA